MDCDIIEFETKYRANFEQLNNEWLEEHFYIEDYDREVLQNPEKYILDPGGQILFAKVQKEIVGVVALIVRDHGVLELSKMGVTDKFQGQKIGLKLMLAAIEYCRNNGANTVMLDSNRKLVPAITLYNKMGFKEVEVPKDTPYERCNIRMELSLI
ncbi:MAG: GNAT superfamily N-acetyltransferase [Parvicellaceae bacterium]|jgi:GNAT superfamily N-acetyltransferase